MDITLAEREVEYPDSDGKPMSDNTEQYAVIVTMTEALEALFSQQPEVFVAGNLLWYPVQGQPKIRLAPETLVAFGRPSERLSRLLSAVAGR
jgi:hypothetical protein